ncbi:class D sortase [Ruminococcaceae bacterium OttesenSCG-928-L11]|nr:class D sortase [Ruminococcaceae bacterium OttesenSCG-928-L11]
MQKAKKYLPNILIALGIAFLVVYVAYSMIGYPWKTLFAQWGLIELAEDLPDPSPLPAMATDQTIPVSDSDGATTGIPDQPDTFAVRPAMNLTQLGIIKIPSIQVSENIVEGSDAEMYYGVGHVKNSAMPGEAGNCVLAAHRSYIYMRPFRYLDKVAVGDNVYITDDKNKYTYQVFTIFEVNPSDAWVMHPQEDEETMLTLITCTPYMVHSHRLIVWCKLTNTQPLE